MKTDKAISSTVSIVDLRKSGRAWKDNGWTDVDVDAGARALCEAARREANPKAVLMTDEQWRQHKHMPALQGYFNDARIVLGAVKKPEPELARIDVKGMD